VLKKSRVTAGTKNFCFLVFLSLNYDDFNIDLLHAKLSQSESAGGDEAEASSTARFKLCQSPNPA